MKDPIPGQTNEGANEQDRFILRDLRRSRSPVWVMVALLPLLLPLLLLVITGFYGLDFGLHWDELKMLGLVGKSIDSGILLPEKFYNYPSMSFWISFVGTGLGIVEAGSIEDTGTGLDQLLGAYTPELRSQLSAYAVTQTNLLRVRGLFLVVSSLTVVWVYLLQLAWRRSWIEALLAASILALSWEVAYHLRWIAPDAILMQFTALTILLVMLVKLRPNHGRAWLRLAALVAGLACGTKYQAGLLLVPVLIAGFQTWDRDSIRRGLLPKFLEVLLIFGFAYLLTTPGTVLAPLDFARGVFYEARHYQTGHRGYTVAAGFEPLRLNLTYFALTLFSQNELIAAFFFIFAVVGIYALLVESRTLALLFLSFPALYVFMTSLQNVMFLRNLLVLAPFFAILSARGITMAWERLRIKWLRIGFAAFVAVLLIVNASWLIYSAETIYNRSPERFVREAAAYINAHPESRFFVSDRVRDDLNALGESQPTNVTLDPHDDADQLLMYQKEARSGSSFWPANQRDLTITWFGPREVNFNYYSSWKGEDRILLMSMDTAREIGVAVIQ